MHLTDSSKKIICIYHSKDLDGYASGAVVKKAFPNATLIGYDYGQPMPKIDDGEEVIMIDVTFPMEEMLWLGARCDLTVIDHHISFNKEYHALGGLEKGTFNYVYGEGAAACEIGWDYFFHGIPMPRAIQLLGAYDTWRQNERTMDWDSEILPFQYGMREVCSSAETFPQELLNTNYGIIAEQRLLDAVLDGTTILSYQAKIDAWHCERCAFERTVFHIGTMDRVLRQLDDNIKSSYKAICVNLGGVSSTTFASVYDPTKHDIMLAFQYNGKLGIWNVSLRTDKPEIDVSVLAKARGGGGNKSAAGFEAKSFDKIFE